MWMKVELFKIHDTGGKLVLGKMNPPLDIMNMLKGK